MRLVNPPFSRGQALPGTAWTSTPMRQPGAGPEETHLHQNQASFPGQASARLFRNLRKERRDAGRSPQAVLPPRAAGNCLDNAETAITDFLQASMSERASTAALALIRESQAPGRPGRAGPRSTARHPGPLRQETHPGRTPASRPNRVQGRLNASVGTHTASQAGKTAR